MAGFFNEEQLREAVIQRLRTDPDTPQLAVEPMGWRMARLLWGWDVRTEAVVEEKWDLAYRGAKLLLKEGRS